MANKTIKFKFIHFHDVLLTFNSDQYDCNSLPAAIITFRQMMSREFWPRMNGLMCFPDDQIGVSVTWGIQERRGIFEFQLFRRQPGQPRSFFRGEVDRMLEEMWDSGI